MRNVFDAMRGEHVTRVRVHYAKKCKKKNAAWGGVSHNGRKWQAAKPLLAHLHHTRFSPSSQEARDE